MYMYMYRVNMTRMSCLYVCRHINTNTLTQQKKQTYMYRHTDTETNTHRHRNGQTTTQTHTQKQTSKHTDTQKCLYAHVYKHNRNTHIQLAKCKYTCIHVIYNCNDYTLLM